MGITWEESSENAKDKEGRRFSIQHEIPPLYDLYRHGVDPNDSHLHTQVLIGSSSGLPSGLW